MTRSTLTALLLALPLAAGAQAIRCTDPATGQVLYTDQPCDKGALVVPPRSPEQIRQDEAAAQQARERLAEEREQQRWREQQRLEAERQAALVRPSHPADSADCRAARQEADFRARSNTATDEQIRTARYNAALACGQQPPADVVVLPPQPVIVQTPVRPVQPGVGWGISGSVSWGSYPPPRPPYPAPLPPPQRPYPPSRYDTHPGGTLDNRAIPVAPRPSQQSRNPKPVKITDQ